MNVPATTVEQLAAELTAYREQTDAELRQLRAELASLQRRTARSVATFPAQEHYTLLEEIAKNTTGIVWTVGDLLRHAEATRNGHAVAPALHSAIVAAVGFGPQGGLNGRKLGRLLCDLELADCTPWQVQCVQQRERSHVWQVKRAEPQ